MTKTKAKNNTEVKKVNKTLSGVVVSDKMKDTCVVLVTRFVKHSKYQKFYKVNKKYKAHDVGNTKKIGDKIKIVSCKPISKDKHFQVVNS